LVIFYIKIAKNSIQIFFAFTIESPLQQHQQHIILMTRGGLAPQTLVGFFSRGPQKKIAAKTKIGHSRHGLERAIAAAQTENFQISADLKKNRGAPWDFSNLVIWPVHPC
jgi:hypothetical protein